MKHTYRFTLLLITLFAGTLFAQTAPQDLLETIKKQNDLAEQIMTGEAEQNYDAYAEDIYSLPDYSPMLKGLEEVKEFTEMQEQMPQTFLEFNFETVDVFGDGDFWIEVGNYSYKMEMPQMSEPWSDVGKYVTVWEKIDGQWKIKTEIWNSDNNPWQMMQQHMKSDDKMHNEKHHKEDKSKEVK